MGRGVCVDTERQTDGDRERLLTLHQYVCICDRRCLHFITPRLSATELAEGEVYFF